MSYGQNKPWGLQAIKSLTSATYNGQTSPYLIESGYNNNIFKGDLVAIQTNGYIVSIYDIGNHSYGEKSCLGVFNGCSYIDPTGTNSIDPASPGRMYWRAGTTTLNGVPAVADIIDDPNVIFNIQTNGNPGLTQNEIGKIALVDIPLIGGIVQGNTSTGQSLTVLQQANMGFDPTHTLRVLRLAGVPGNNAGLQYNNAEVLIQNHLYCSRPPGINT